MNPADRLDEVKALLLYSEVYHQRPTSALVKTLLGRLNRFQFLSFMCALSSIMHNNAGIAMQPTWQIDFVKNLGSVSGGGRVIDMLTRSKRVLLHEVQVGLLARYALQYCEAETTVGDFSDVVLRLFLALPTFWWAG